MRNVMLPRQPVRRSCEEAWPDQTGEERQPGVVTCRHIAIKARSLLAALENPDLKQ